MNGFFGILINWEYSGKMIVGLTLEWPLNTPKRELGAGRWQEDAACFHLSLGLRISGWVVFMQTGVGKEAGAAAVGRSRPSLEP